MEERAALECGLLDALAADDGELDRLIGLHDEFVNVRFVSAEGEVKHPRMLRDSATVGDAAAFLGAVKSLSVPVAVAFDHTVGGNAGRVIADFALAGGSFDMCRAEHKVQADRLWDAF